MFIILPFHSVKLPALVTALLAVALSGLLTGCHDQKADPAPPTTAVQGQVTQLTAARSVVAVALSSTTDSVITILRVPSATGSYRFDSLAAGTYTLSFMPGSGYLAPAAQTVQVTAGTTTTAATVTPASGPYHLGTQGSAAYTVDGTAETKVFVQAQKSDNTLSVFIGTTPANPLPGVAYRRTVSLQLTRFADQVGTFYPASQATNASLTYTEFDGVSQALWGSTGTPPGSVVITAVSAAPRRVSGTFTAAVVPVGSTAGSHLIVGSFTDVPY